jgi:hypothetical protein
MKFMEYVKGGSYKSLGTSALCYGKTTGKQDHMVNV